MAVLTGPPLWILLISVLLLAPPLDPGVILGDFIPDEYKGKANPLKDTTIAVEDVFFPSHGETLHAWLYSQPPAAETIKEEEEEGEEVSAKEDSDVRKDTESTTTTTTTTTRPAPVVLMAPGLGTQKDMGLDRYAEKFVQAGFAVFMFDYRNFAASTGQPRNWVSPKRHIEDYHSALDFIESMPDQIKDKVDGTKIFLWGTSFSGGHVLEVASTRSGSSSDTNILGVVSQVPHLSGKEAAKKGIKTRGIIKTLRLVLAVLQDKAREIVGLPPVGIQIIGSGNDRDDMLSIMMVSPEDHTRYINKQPAQKLGGWKNQAPARMLLELRFYNPIETLQQKSNNADGGGGITIPVLLIGSKLDALCPPALIEQATSLIPNSKLILRDGSHFEIYEDRNYLPVSEEMIKHFKSCLA